MVEFNETWIPQNLQYEMGTKTLNVPTGEEPKSMEKTNFLTPAK